MITIVTDSEGFEQYIVTEADGTRYSLCDRPEVDHPGKPCRHYVDEYVVTLTKQSDRTPEQRAGQNLGAFMIAAQAAMFDATGVMPVPCSDAPNNYGELLQAAARWQYALGDVFLPVWEGASEDSIYGSAAANHAFRYWHDMGHIAHHCDFTPDGEKRLQFDHHLPIIADHFGIGSLEYSLYYADTVGQIEYVVENGKFPANQAAFVSAYVRNARLALNTDY